MAGEGGKEAVISSPPNNIRTWLACRYSLLLFTLNVIHFHFLIDGSQLGDQLEIEKNGPFPLEIFSRSRISSMPGDQQQNMKQSYTGSALFQAQWNTGVLIVVLGSSAEWHCCTLWNLHSVQLWRLHTRSLCKCLLHSPSPKSERDLSCYHKWRCWPVKVVRPCCLWLQYVVNGFGKDGFLKMLGAWCSKAWESPGVAIVGPWWLWPKRLT